MKRLALGILAGLCVGQAVAATTVTVSDRDALVKVTGDNTAFDAVVRVQPSVANSLELSFAALDGEFSNVKYSFWLDQALTARVLLNSGRPTNDYAMRDLAGQTVTSFAKGVDLMPFQDSNRPSFDLAAQPYFLRLTGTMLNGSGDLTGLLKVTASSAVIAAVPEPETYAMFLAGLGVIAAVARRRRQ